MKNVNFSLGTKTEVKLLKVPEGWKFQSSLSPKYNVL